MTKTIMILVIAAVLVAGSIGTGTTVFADEENTQLLELLMELETQIISMQTEILLLGFNMGEPGPQGPQGEIGPQGPQGETGPSSEVLVFNVQGPRFVNAPVDTVLMSKSFVLSVPSSVLVQVDAIGLNRGAADQLFWYGLEVDGNKVAETLSSAAGRDEWNQAGLNWAGELGVGAHTIEVKLVVAFTGNICSGKDCNLSILAVG